MESTNEPKDVIEEYLIESTTEREVERKISRKDLSLVLKHKFFTASAENPSDWPFDQFCEMMTNGWDAVVRVEAKDGLGTGFLLYHPYHTKGRRFIITNRHVATDLEAKYTIRFFYDSVDADYVECQTLPPAHFYSDVTLANAPYACLRSDRLDFVVLELNLEALGLNEKDRILAVSPLKWEESARVNTLFIPAFFKGLNKFPGFIIGHPLGEPKVLTIGSFIERITNPNYDPNAHGGQEPEFLPVIRYDIPTAGGSSGSPVFPFPRNNIFGEMAMPIALHYRGTLGVTFNEGIADMIRDQFARQ